MASNETYARFKSSRQPRWPAWRNKLGWGYCVGVGFVRLPWSPRLSPVKRTNGGVRSLGEHGRSNS